MKTRWSHIFSAHKGSLVDQMLALLNRHYPDIDPDFSGSAIFSIAPNAMVWELNWSSDISSIHDWDDDRFLLSFSFDPSVSFEDTGVALGSVMDTFMAQLVEFEDEDLRNEQSRLVEKRHEIINSSAIDNLGVDVENNSAVLSFTALVEDRTDDTLSPFLFDSIHDATAKAIELQNSLSPFELFSKSISVALIFCNRMPNGKLKPWFTNAEGETTMERFSFDVYSS